jgi:polyphosphate kinase
MAMAEVPSPVPEPPAEAPSETSVPLLNRELSWLAFNERVIEEAEDTSHPLFERLKFLAISQTNLDEFFMIRIAGLRAQLSAEVTEPSVDGMTPAEQLDACRRAVKKMIQRQTKCLVEDLVPRLADAGITILPIATLDESRRTLAEDYFRRTVFPVLTPLSFDPAHPFPFLSNLSLNVAAELKNPDSGAVQFARVKVPPTLPRLVPLRRIVLGKKKLDPEHADFVLLEDLIQANLGHLFPGMTIVSSYLFRVTRDADIEIQDDEAGDLRATIEHEVRQRRFGAVVRLEVAPRTPKRVRKLLAKQLEIQDEDVYEAAGPLGAGDFFAITRLDRKELKDPPFTPAVPPALGAGHDIFAAIRDGDVLLHHPYDSFSPVVQLIDAAASDPKVLAIKMTLYRTNSESPFIRALIHAAEQGKQVAVLVELKARFDEEHNIEWAKALEEAGVHVVYGSVGLKTHAKIALVVRREKEEIRRYVHLSTGNYNSLTAKVYTDLGLLTARPEIGDDATELFNSLTGCSLRAAYRCLVLAPRDLHRRTLEWIERETKNAREGKPSGIKAKMNALLDPAVIKALYEASQAGVPIDLAIRGVCCLRPQLKGFSERIRVTSVVGRFLEHSRIFAFVNGGSPEVYLSSADWMPRNFFRRVEAVFPLVDPALARHALEILEDALRDTARARELRSDGTYVRVKPADERPFDSQANFLEDARRRTQRAIEQLRRGPFAEEETSETTPDGTPEPAGAEKAAS